MNNSNFLPFGKFLNIDGILTYNDYTFEDIEKLDNEKKGGCLNFILGPQKIRDKHKIKIKKNELEKFFKNITCIKCKENITYKNYIESTININNDNNYYYNNINENICRHQFNFENDIIKEIYLLLFWINKDKIDNKYLSYKRKRNLDISQINNLDRLLNEFKENKKIKEENKEKIVTKFKKKSVKNYLNIVNKIDKFELIKVNFFDYNIYDWKVSILVKKNITIGELKEIFYFKKNFEYKPEKIIMIIKDGEDKKKEYENEMDDFELEKILFKKNEGEISITFKIIDDELKEKKII